MADHIIFYTNLIQYSDTGKVQQFITVANPLTVEMVADMPEGTKLVSSTAHYMKKPPLYHRGQVKASGLILNWKIQFNKTLDRFAYIYLVQPLKENIDSEPIWLWEDKVNKELEAKVKTLEAALT